MLELQDVSVRVEAGELVTITEVNESGKSTLLLTALVHRPGSGSYLATLELGLAGQP